MAENKYIQRANIAIARLIDIVVKREQVTGGEASLEVEIQTAEEEARANPNKRILVMRLAA